MNTPCPTCTETGTPCGTSKLLEVRNRSNYAKNHHRWGVAQLAERLAVNQEVVGSTPTAPVDVRPSFVCAYGRGLRLFCMSLSDGVTIKSPVPFRGDSGPFRTQGYPYPRGNPTPA